MDNTDRRPALRGGLIALIAALLFGVSTPLVQRFGTAVGSFTTAALLYAGAALIGALLRRPIEREARIQRSAVPRLALMALFGAVVGPVALAWGLQRTSGAGASLMLTLEAVFTAGLATGYGLSLRFDLLAQRAFGAARTGSVFAFAPFVGALFALVLGDRSGSAWMLAGAVLMASGIVLHLAERHAHDHAHDGVEHEHAHRHDDGHHLHAHDTLPAGQHSHLHRHEPMRHSHAHVPDEQHAHRH